MSVDEGASFCSQVVSFMVWFVNASCFLRNPKGFLSWPFSSESPWMSFGLESVLLSCTILLEKPIFSRNCDMDGNCLSTAVASVGSWSNFADESISTVLKLSDTIPPPDVDWPTLSSFGAFDALTLSSPFPDELISVVSFVVDSLRDIFSLKLAIDGIFDVASCPAPASVGGFEDGNFFDMNKGGVLPKLMLVVETFCENVFTDCFILSTFSGLEKSLAKLLRRCSSSVSRVIERSMIFCKVLAVFSLAGAFVNSSCS